MDYPRVNADYRMKCLGCHLGRRFGRGRLTAQLFADKHNRKFPTHSIQILNGDKVMEVRVPKYFMKELPFGVDEPPF